MKKGDITLSMTVVRVSSPASIFAISTAFFSGLVTGFGFGGVLIVPIMGTLGGRAARAISNNNAFPPPCIGTCAARVGVACSPPPNASSTLTALRPPPLALDPDMDIAPTLAREATEPRLESAGVRTSGEVLIGLGPSDSEYELAVVVGVVYAADGGGG